MNPFMDIAQDPRLAVGVSATTTGTWVGTVLDMIPSNIGNLSLLIGGILSLVLIVVHLRREFRDTKYARAKLKALERREALRDEMVRLRAAARRHDD